MEQNDDAADCVYSIRIGTGVVSKVKWKKYILSKSGMKDVDAEKRQPEPMR
jgi:ferredoxin-fold anticodon binding domain-containing protein